MDCIWLSLLVCVVLNLKLKFGFVLKLSEHIGQKKIMAASLSFHFIFQQLPAAKGKNIIGGDLSAFDITVTYIRYMVFKFLWKKVWNKFVFRILWEGFDICSPQREMSRVFLKRLLLYAKIDSKSFLFGRSLSPLAFIVQLS